MRKGSAAAAAAIISALGVGAALAQTTVQMGVYTAEQATRGFQVVTSVCAQCHGGDLTGTPGAPGLVGSLFMFDFGDKTAGDLFTYVKTMMPPGQPGSLTDQQYVDSMAAIFSANGFPVGTTELPTDPAALTQIVIAKP